MFYALCVLRFLRVCMKNVYIIKENLIHIDCYSYATRLASAES